MFGLFKKEPKKTVPAEPEPIVIFCYEKPGVNASIPFAYILGGPGLIHEGAKPVVPGRDGLGYDWHLMAKMKERVLDEEFKGSGILKYKVYAIAGYVVGGKAMCQDLVKDLNNVLFSHVDMLNPSDGEGVRVMGFDMTEVQKGRRIPFDPAWTAPKPGPDAPMPQTKEELIHTIGDYTGADIFDSCERLGIDLHDNIFNFEKLEVPQLQKVLYDLRVHVRE